MANVVNLIDEVKWFAGKTEPSKRINDKILGAWKISRDVLSRCVKVLGWIKPVPPFILYLTRYPLILNKGFVSISPDTKYASLLLDYRHYITDCVFISPYLLLLVHAICK